MRISTRLRWITWVIFLVLGILLSLITDFLLKKSGFVFKFSIAGRLIGLLLIFISSLIARNTGKTLKRYGIIGKVPKFETNKLVRKGIYSCMRHPMHFGLMLLPEGIAFLMDSFSYIFIYAPLNILAIFILIKKIEEPEAIGKFGDEYIKYIEEVPFINLSFNCFKKLFTG